MNIIVAIDKNWGIGLNNNMLCNIPSDMRFLRDATKDKVVVMGRKSYEALPTRTIYGNRTNIVLTKDKNFHTRQDVMVLHSMAELMKELEKYPSEDVFVVGGQSIYEQMLPYCDTAYVTQIDFTYQADKHHPNLDQMEEWEKVSESDENTYYNIEYTYAKYIRKK